MYYFETDKIRERKHLKRVRTPVVRSDQKKYKSLRHAALRNKTTSQTIKKYIESQKKLNGYLFDYQ